MESKHNTKDSHQITRKERKKETKRTTKQPQNNYKIAITTYLSIITLNINGLMLQSKDIEWLHG